MRRRYLQLDRDYAQLLDMQRVSYALNFPGQELQVQWFRTALMTAESNKRIWVYEQDGTIVAWLWLDRDEPGILHITHIQVREDCWGKGIGRNLMQEAKKIALHDGRIAITLNVTKTNVRATKLYAALGYATVTEQEDRRLMRLELAPTTIDSNG
jgi:ribosomal protein S18 acetylase RimI-like enzyme